MHSIIIFPTEITFFECRVRAGFESPATDYVQKRVDLNKELIQHQEATYGFIVEGDSMEGIGIFKGDRVLIDKAIIPAHAVSRLLLAIILRWLI